MRAFVKILSWTILSAIVIAMFMIRAGISMNPVVALIPPAPMSIAVFLIGAIPSPNLERRTVRGISVVAYGEPKSDPVMAAMALAAFALTWAAMALVFP